MHLRQIVSVCGHCERICDDKNYWSSAEKYFSDHSSINFTYGICVDCMKKKHPDIYERLKQQGRI